MCSAQVDTQLRELSEPFAQTALGKDELTVQSVNSMFLAQSPSSCLPFSRPLPLQVYHKQAWTKASQYALFFASIQKKPSLISHDFAAFHPRLAGYRQVHDGHCRGV